MPKETQKPSPGRIVLVVIGTRPAGKTVEVVKCPAIISSVLPADEKREAPERIVAHVFMNGARDGDWSQTQYREGLTYEAEAKSINTWSWPTGEKTEIPAT